MLALLTSAIVWLRHRLAWSNSRQSWGERAAGGLWLAAVAATVHFASRVPRWQAAALAGILVLALLLLLQRGWIKLLGPVFFYDVVRSARRGRYFLLRAAYALLILALLYWTYFVWTLRSTGGGVPVEEMADFSETFFFVFLAVQAGAVLIFTPAYAAGAIAEEKEHKTLEFLLATDLRNREIVLGKLASRLGNLVLLILTGLPILSLMELLGGVEPVLVGAAFAVTLLTMTSLVALSLLCSVYSRRARNAILFSYLLACAYPAASGTCLWLSTIPDLGKQVIVPAGVAPFLARTAPDDPDTPPEELPFTFADLAERLNDGSLPVFCVRVGEDLNKGLKLSDVLPGLLRNYAIFHLAAAALCTVWATSRLRSAALADGRSRNAEGRRFAHLLRRPGVGRFPLFWEEVIVESGFRSHWTSRAITYLLGIFILVPTAAIAVDYLSHGREAWDGLANGWVHAMIAGASVLSFLAVAVRASAAVSGDRERQTLDSLLTTPVSSDAILFNKWLGSLLGFRWAALLVMIALVACALMGGLSYRAILILMVAWPAYAGLVAMIGLWFSIVSPTTLRATAWTLLATAGVCVGHWLLWLVYLPWLVLGDVPRTSYESIARLHVGLTPPLVLTAAALEDADWANFFQRDFNHALGAGVETARYAAGGLALWLAATVVVWFVASRRFRSVTNRLPFPDPGPPPPEGEIKPSRLPRQRLRRRLVVATLVVAPMVAVVAGYVVFSYVGDRKLRAGLAELDAADPGWRLADLEAARATLPVAENSAEQVRAVRKLLPRPWPPLPVPAPGSPPGSRGLFDDLRDLAPEQQLSESNLQKLRELLAPTSVARTEALKLSHLPRGRYPITWAPLVVNTVLNDQQESRTVTEFLRSEAILRAQDGDADLACTCVRAQLNVARAVGDEPFLISHFIRLAERAVTLQTLERVLAQGTPSSDALARLQTALEEEERVPVLRIACRGERAFFHEIMEEVRSGKLKPSLFMGGSRASDLAAAATSKSAHVVGLRHLTRYVEVADLPLHEQAAAAQALDAEVRDGPWLLSMLLPGMNRVPAAFRRSQANLRCGIVAVAAERFRHKQGRWPESLSELIAAGFVQEYADPYDGAPLRFRRLDDGVIVYSVGEDKEDNGGHRDRKKLDAAGTDQGMRLWDLGSRRQPAAPAGAGP